METVCRALATGESLGQVASQTLPNLAAIEDAATLPILRPLLGFDKLETIELARRIGTYDVSIRAHEDCCTLFVPRHPQTRGSIPRAKRLEDAHGLLQDLGADAVAGQERDLHRRLTRRSTARTAGAVPRRRGSRPACEA